MTRATLEGALAERYTIDEPIGAGGMATVYRATDVRHARPVALKVMHPEFAATIGRERFLREIRVTANLQHPHILPLHDSGEVPGGHLDPERGERAGPSFLYYVTPLVEGMSLRQRLEREGRLPLPDVRKIAGEVAGALEHAHARGIVHRDIKPENILLSGYTGAAGGSAWSTVLADFGVAAVRDAAREDRLTQTGTSVGSVLYMSPEQALGDPVDHRADIWALGCVVYEMLAGEPPFGRDGKKALGRALSERAAPIRLPGAEAINDALSRALSPEPAERFQSAAEFSRALGGEAPARRSRRRTTIVLLLVGAVAVGLAAALAVSLRPTGQRTLEFTQLTNFTDAASAPALSPDGRTVVFLKGSGFFGNSATPGEVYVKQLPDGEAVQLTNTRMGKATPAFSRDGARIAFTSTGPNFGWRTFSISTNGGAVTELLPNASALTWLDERHVLFSEVRRGVHMGIRQSTLARDEARDVYWPASELGMAHRSAASPDGRWVLVAEMDNGVWQPCRVVPLDGSSPGHRAGPDAQCTYAAWAPDGRRMYFTASVGGAFHIWRQGFREGVPDGQLEQLTYGPTEEEGLAVAPDGRSLITSAGVRMNSIWVSDREGERQVSVEGYAFSPVVSTDGTRIYFLSQTGSARGTHTIGHLIAITLSSGAREQVLPEYSMAHFDLSADGRSIAFVSGSNEEAKRGIWIAPLDRSSPPRRVFAGETDRVFFDPAGDIYFLSKDGSRRFLQRSRAPEYVGEERIHPDAFMYLFAISADGEWIVGVSPRGQGGGLQQVAVSTRGLPARVLCSSCSYGAGPTRIQPPPVSWTRDGRTFVVTGQFGAVGGMAGAPGAAFTILVPVRPGRALPDLPAGGVESLRDYLELPGARTMQRGNMLAGASAAQLFFYESTVIRNLYRVQLPR